jgi:hypothetical protein
MNLTIREIRLNNLLLLLKESGLSQSAFAVKAETSAAYISQIISIKTKRNMGDFVARNIELAFKKPKGWMDNQHHAEE